MDGLSRQAKDPSLVHCTWTLLLKGHRFPLVYDHSMMSELIPEFLTTVLEFIFWHQLKSLSLAIKESIPYSILHQFMKSSKQHSDIVLVCERERQTQSSVHARQLSVVFRQLWCSCSILGDRQQSTSDTHRWDGESFLRRLFTELGLVYVQQFIRNLAYVFAIRIRLSSCNGIYIWNYLIMLYFSQQ